MASEDSFTEKKIHIQGTNNRYQIKKVMKVDKQIKKRIVSEKWDFTLEYEKQLIILNQLFFDNISENKIYNDVESTIMLQQINQKIYGYKRQDILKSMWDETHFIDITHIISKLLDVKALCYYCAQQMSILYDVSREMKQWTVDRIDNDKGHNKDNYHLACLQCNLKRRRQSEAKFLFTKQLNIIKYE